MRPIVLDAPKDDVSMSISPQFIDLDPSSPNAPVHVWLESDPGYSFTFRLGLIHEDTKQLLSTDSTIHYASRVPAIVLSKTTTRLMGGEYYISLSLSPPKPVRVRISTYTDSVCLDLDANFERPCSRYCRRCLNDLPEVNITPRVVTLSKESKELIQLHGWADNHLLEPL